MFEKLFKEKIESLIPFKDEFVFYDFIWTFCKENCIDLVEFDTTWVEKSENRRVINTFKVDDVDYFQYKNKTDEWFFNKLRKDYKTKDFIFIQSTFFGIKYCNFYFNSKSYRIIGKATEEQQNFNNLVNLYHSC